MYVRSVYRILTRTMVRGVVRVKMSAACRSVVLRAFVASRLRRRKLDAPTTLLLHQEISLSGRALLPWVLYYLLRVVSSPTLSIMWALFLWCGL